MPTSRTLLAIIGRRMPAIYDVIPRGPQGHVLGMDVSKSALNPQPIPPGVIGAAIADEFIHAAWFADRFSLDPQRVRDDLDDWCPTGQHRLKLPPWWPPHPGPNPPDPDWLTDFHLGFAIRLATVAVEHEGTQLGGFFEKAIDRSIAQTIQSDMGAQRR